MHFRRVNPFLIVIFRLFGIYDMKNTVWKFQDFVITQILCEINFKDSKGAKSAISTHLEALNFDF